MFAFFLLAIAAAGAGPDPGAPCSAPITAALLLEEIAAAELSFGDLDVAGFQAHSDRVGTLAPCLAEAVPVSVAARLHRLLAVDAFVDQDPALAALEARAALRLDPGLTLSFAAIPAEHPLQAVWSAAAATSSPSMDVPAPPSGRILWDGRPATRRPADLPGLAQREDADGSILGSALVGPAADLPAPLLAAAPAPLVATAPQAASGGRRRHPSRGLALAAGGCALAAGGLYYLAWDAHDQFWDPLQVRTDARDLRVRTNTYYVSSMGAAGLAGTLTLTAILVGRW